MTDAATIPSSEAPAEARLRDALARGDVMIGTVGPVLGHLLANHDLSLFSDEIVSRVRGMITGIARQILALKGGAPGAVEPSPGVRDELAALTGALMAEGALVSHCHALALEWQLTARLEGRHGIDPILSPLLQALIASDDPPTAANAMATLAAQARFAQQQRRMELPITELPADLFQQTIATWLDRAIDDEADTRHAAAALLREGYDEGASRLGLLSRLVHTMGAGALAALSVSHAGPAIFISALGFATQQDRELVVLATNDRQFARLAVSLRAAGLRPSAIEEQFLHIYPETAPPDDLETLRPDRAQGILAAARRTLAG